MAAMSYKERESKFLEMLGASKIDKKLLRNMCFAGIVDSCGVRSICWRILLNYLPGNRETWPTYLQEQRNIYRQFVNEMIVKPGLQQYDSQRTDVTFEDHPLNPSPKSEWNSYFQDNTILLQINKDVRRLCPDIAFFQNPTPNPCQEIVNPENRVETLRKRVEKSVLTSLNVTKNRDGVTNLINSRKKAMQEYETPTQEGSEAHWEVVERILFIYAKLNPGTGYVQGMNEIIGPLYYTLASDPNKEWAEHAECDTFFCFQNLMSEIRDNFIKSLDGCSTGIGGSMDRVLRLLKRVDVHLWLCLEKLSIRPEFYLFRWVTLLLSQEFSLPDTIRLWDSLFSDPSRFNFLVAICAAMIILVRDELLSSEFGQSMKLLQNFPDIDIETIIRKAISLQ